MTDLSNNSLSDDIFQDLDWVAVQYLSNELSAQEALRFEQLLAEQQDAREALSSAVQLIAGLKSIDSMSTLNVQAPAFQQNALNARSVFFSRNGALAASAVVILLATSFLLTESPVRNTSAPQIVQTEPSQAELEYLLNLWSESAEDNSIVSLNSNTEQTDLIDQQNVLAENHALEVPDWLYTAVSLPEESVN